MNKFFVVGNREKKNIKETGIYIEKYLKDNGKECELLWGYVKKEDVPESTECVIVLGGDGTLLQASRELMGLNGVFIGVNFGHLGFLAEVEQDGIDDMLKRLISDDFSIEERIMIQGDVVRDDKIIASDVALNDIVLNRSGALRIMYFSICVNGLKLIDYKADGMIISTPTGSTAYSMSAGGPIVQPSANLIVLTPICPHTLNTRSIILDGEDIVEIDLYSKRKNENDVRNVYFDGDRAVNLQDGDKIIIKKAELSTNIVKLSSMSFLEILGRKMSDNESSQA